MQNPNADLWALAAQACDDREQAIRCLRRALEIDPWHGQANRLLLKIEGARPLAEQRRESKPMPAIVPIDDAPLAKPVKQGKAQPKRKRGGRRWIILLSILLFGSSCSLLTLNLIGLVSGPVTALTTLTGGPTPMAEIDGVPLEQVADAPAVAPAAQSEPIDARDADMLEPGYLHEYAFEAVVGNTAAVYVQFLSLGANRVSRNVAILDSSGRDRTADCDRSAILEGDNNVVYQCPIDRAGTWRVRILGRNGESVGAYFVGVEWLEGL
jgi:hypothetical protein